MVITICPHLQNGVAFAVRDACLWPAAAMACDPCPVCGSNSFLDVAALEAHVQAHFSSSEHQAQRSEGKLLASCSHAGCSKRVRLSELDEHEATHR